MKTMPLADFVDLKGQAEAAQLLGCTAPAIWKALTAKRQITVHCSKDGSFTASEVREFPSQKPRTKVA